MPRIWASVIVIWAKKNNITPIMCANRIRPNVILFESVFNCLAGLSKGFKTQEILTSKLGTYSEAMNKILDVKKTSCCCALQGSPAGFLI